jgi:hypothetical protein
MQKAEIEDLQFQVRLSLCIGFCCGIAFIDLLNQYGIKLPLVI